MLLKHLFKLTASDIGKPQPAESSEQWPTYENMVTMFDRVIEVAKPGDQVYIHYSGHGGRAKTTYPQLKGENGIDEVLVPLDIRNPTSRYLRDLELAALLQKMVNKGLVVTVEQANFRWLELPSLDQPIPPSSTRGLKAPRNQLEELFSSGGC